MLEPREADLPALLLVLVVLPIVTYILLGKWNEVSKKQARISMLAQLAAEEAHSAEATVAATIITPVTRSPSTIGQHECAQCSAPATTRCSRCKSVRYCSGNCQIVHWRQVHKLECLQPNDNNSSQCADLTRVSDSFHQTENHDSVPESLPVEVLLQPPITCATNFSIAESSTGLTNDSKNLNRRDSHKQNKKKIKNEVGSDLSDVQECITSEPAVSFELIDALQRPKLVRNIDTASSAEIPIKQKVSCPAISVRGPPYKLQDHDGKLFIGKGNGISTSLNSEDSNLANHDILMGYWSSKSGFAYQGDFKSFTENVSDRGCTTPGRTYLSDISGSASQISTRISMEYAYSMIEGKGLIANESKVPQSDVSTYIPRESSNTPKSFNNKLPGQKKLPKLSKRDNTGHASNNLKKTVALFPYDEFVKFFQCEIMNISPRGLLNCGNSCYANAVLQCLTSTKPLIVYLLRRIHSKNCWERDWCLICELEQHVLMLREGGGDALCPSRILLHMKNVSCHMGGGNQEDAHEFLRLLVASMQSLCLEGVGGEKDVHPRLQKTTFIQHTFGGSLRSKVKCLRCHHESERYENILDLTLEILGRVESLEDAFTQFTAPEDLDGENMYKCLRCATYVKARKQLSIHEAPNILTIVLKRFQTGKYGKINKCISFPDMLDMVPFMTGTGDSPPLYMLYGVVVHLDTLNASFSGHYVSYVKDMQGTWFRVDDTQVEPVPMSQVMSEGAYILFYSRSYPRPPRILCNAKTTNIEAPVSAKLFASKTQNFFRHERANKPSNLSDDPVLCLSSNGWNVHRPEIGLVQTNYSDPNRTDNADSTSSDWSLFTSSDESSFTTESTRDSFSTVDYMETLNGDPVSSLFTSFSIPEYFNSTVPCRKFSPCRPETKFISEKNGFVLDSSLPPTLHLGNFVSKGRNSESVGAYMVESFPSGKSNCSMYAEYGSNPEDSMIQTCRSHRH